MCRLKKLFLAVDSGGSKTIWRVIDSEGNTVEVLRTDGMGSNPGILPVDEITAGARDKLKNGDRIALIFLSLGGPNTEEVESALKKSWSGAAVQVTREANGDAILKAAEHFSCRSAVLCGTGSTAVGIKGGQRRFSGGWGPLYGDFGSGGGIGKDALVMFLQSLDGEAKESGLSSLFSSLTEGVDVADFYGRMEVKRRAIGLKRKDLADLVPSLYDLYLAGNPDAVTLFRQAAEAIARMADDVTDDSPDASVLLCGGLFAGKPDFLELCRAEFAKLSRAGMVYNPKIEPIAGACIGVLESAGVEVTQEIFDRILNGQETKGVQR